MLDTRWRSHTWRALGKWYDGRRLAWFHDGVNNREKATLIWLGIALAAALTKREIRGSLWECIKSFAHLQLVAPLLAFAGWTVGLVALAHAVGLWESDVRNDTVVWFITVGLAFFFSLDKVKEGRFFQTAARCAVAVTVFVEGFANLAVFGLVVEFFLLPILVLLGGVLAVSESKEEYAPARPVVNGLLAVIGVCVLVYVLTRLAGDFDADHTLRALALPIWLTIGSLPFVHAFGLLAEYEGAFLRIDFRTDDPAHRRSAKWALLRAGNIRASEVGGFTGHWISDLASAESRDDARAVARRWRGTWRAERHAQRMCDARMCMQEWLSQENPTFAEIHADTFRRSWDRLNRTQRAALKAEGLSQADDPAHAENLHRLPD